MDSKGVNPYIYMCPWSPKGRESFLSLYLPFQASQVVLVVKNLPTNAGDARDRCLIPGLGKSPGVENGNLLQYSCLENSRWMNIFLESIITLQCCVMSTTNWHLPRTLSSNSTTTRAFVICGGTSGKEPAC